MRIAYYSHAGRQTGYGRAATSYLLGLSAIEDAVVTIAPLDRALDEQSVCDVAVYHATPAQLEAIVKAGKLGAPHVVAITTWETSIFPYRYAEMLKAFDGVVVPSRFCARVIGDSFSTLEGAIKGADKKRKIWIVPHAYDPAAWPLAEPERVDDVFTFYSIGAWSERKNMAGVIRAYLHVFDKSHRTRLVIISENARFDVIRSIIARSGLKQEDLPGLLVPDHQLSADEIYRLHRDSDCYVTAARCEGFGLGMFEAMVMGKPIIAPGYGGQEDFLEEYDVWYKVSHQQTPVFGGEGEVDVRGEQAIAKVTLPRGADARQLWAEPNLAQMSHRMVDIFCEKPPRPRARPGDREVLDDTYSTTVVGQQLYQVLERVIR